MGLLSVWPSLHFWPLVSGAIIGRADDCTVQLQSDQVSRQHARVERDGPLWLLKDLGSKNGTWVNRTRVDLVNVKDQDVVRIGDCVGVVCTLPRSAIDDSVVVEALGPSFLASAQTLDLLSPLKGFARHELPVVIYGETGAGKDALAQTIHHWSGRSGPFVAVNCAAIPEGVAEALLLGHRKGAFTGAQDARDGYVRAAHGGTLFLDEIANLPLSVQAKLLRVLEEHRVTPLGATRPIEVDFRIIAACQEPLQQLVEEGVFRMDLHARLRTVEITVPPLRRRRQEILPLLLRFLRLRGIENPTLDSRLVEAVCAYVWPYNVREVEQLAAVLAASHRSRWAFSDLPERFREEPCVDPAPGRSELFAPVNISARRKAWLARHIEELVRLRAALEKHDGNITNAALEIGVPRHRARRLLAAEAELSDAARG
ncbi:MAG TPA: sigma 54-interacting transcriptional regulator [Polyangiaceae bacterium]|nr:sigma 54-interacting transcriptional regulator [Polyangiaceae bacterium]